jgi:parallel beta-helix repeat protein
MKRSLLVVLLLSAIAFACACEAPLVKKAEVVVEPTGGDASAAFKKAIDDVKDGGTVRLRAGTYRLNQPIQVLKSVTIVGEGLDKTKVVGSTGESVIEFNGHTTVTVQGVAFSRSGREGGDAVDVVAATATFTDCTFSGAIAGAVSGGNGLAFFNESKGTVKSCDASDNEHSGIHVQDTAKVELTANTCGQNGDAGIAFIGEAGGTATGNTCTTNDFDGIHVQDKCKPALVKNTCTKNRQAGILYIGQAGGQASENKCSENGGPGISVGETAAPELLGNRCTKNPFGLAFYDHAAGMAQGNLCPSVRPGDIGIAVFDKAKPKLLHNKAAITLTP